jgi:hypothetical protein
MKERPGGRVSHSPLTEHDPRGVPRHLAAQDPRPRRGHPFFMAYILGAHTNPSNLVATLRTD